MSAPDAALPRRLWQVAGGLALAHIVLMLAGFTATPISRLGDTAVRAVAIYRGGSATAASIGGAVSVLSFVALLCAVPLFARLLGGESETGRWLGAVIAISGTLYVGLTLAVPFPASSAARYAARHGVPAETVLAISNLHWFGAFLSTVLLGVFTAALAAAALVTRRLPRWLSIAGFVAAALCLTAAVQPPENVVDNVTLVWMVWFVLFAVASLRAGRRSRRSDAVPVAL